MELNPNPKKNLVIEIDGKKYARYPVRTHVITPEDKDLASLVEKYVKTDLESGDFVFMGEKAIAISQGRAYPKDTIKPSGLAKFLVRYVTKTPIGIGLGSPETMQLAIDEVGVPRIVVAAFFGAIAKVFGMKGVFYMIAGEQASSIDGAADYVMPPYNKYVSKGPARANEVAQEVSSRIGVPFAIVDACDFGVKVLGASNGMDKNFMVKVLKDNPLGQTNEQTPIGIIREVKE